MSAKLSLIALCFRAARNRVVNAAANRHAGERTLTG